MVFNAGFTALGGLGGWFKGLSRKPCFAARMTLRTPEGSKPTEQFPLSWLVLAEAQTVDERCVVGLLSVNLPHRARDDSGAFGRPCR
jgi:hypothetical protein